MIGEIFNACGVDSVHTRKRNASAALQPTSLVFARAFALYSRERQVIQTVATICRLNHRSDLKSIIFKSDDADQDGIW